jgi:estrogen-related receptor beta like 1
LCCVVHIADAQDWRAHLEQMQRHRSGIDEALATTKSQLDKLHSDIEVTLEKISSREKFLNSQLEPLLVQYRSLQVSSNKLYFVANRDALFT